MARLSAFAQFLQQGGKRRQIGKGANEPARTRQDKRAFQHSQRFAQPTLQMVRPRLQGQHLDRLARIVHGFDMLQELGEQRLSACDARCIALGKQHPGLCDGRDLKEDHRTQHLLLPRHLEPLLCRLYLVLQERHLSTEGIGHQELGHVVLFLHEFEQGTNGLVRPGAQSLGLIS